MAKDANLEMVYSDHRFTVLRCKITGLMVCVPKHESGSIEWIEPHDGYKLNKYIATAA